MAIQVSVSTYHLFKVSCIGIDLSPLESIGYQYRLTQKLTIAPISVSAALILAVGKVAHPTSVSYEQEVEKPWFETSMLWAEMGSIEILVSTIRIVRCFCIDIGLVIHRIVGID